MKTDLLGGDMEQGRVRAQNPTLTLIDPRQAQKKTFMYHRKDDREIQAMLRIHLGSAMTLLFQ